MRKVYLKKKWGQIQLIDLSKIIITGGEGMIAQELSFGIKLSRRQMDVTNKEQIKQVFSQINPSGVICLSAITDIKLCEQNPLYAYEVNVFGAYNLACEASQRDIPFVLVSTGAVFNGPAEKLFNEEDIPNPKNIYGQTKYLAEIIIKTMMKKSIIVRTGWVFGGNSKKNRFSKFVNDLIIPTTKDKNMIATTDQKSSPTYVVDFSNKLKEIILSDYNGTIHLTNSGDGASAMDVAKEIILITGNATKVNAAKIKEFNRNSPKRSMSESLISTKLKLRDWREALKEYVLLFKKLKKIKYKSYITRTPGK